MKNITTQQIEAILATVYQTNISAQTFDALRKLLSELPDAPTEEKNDKEK
jgi:transposase-like protein